MYISDDHYDYRSNMNHKEEDRKKKYIVIEEVKKCQVQKTLKAIAPLLFTEKNQTMILWHNYIFELDIQ